jgi:predicted PilT family ATPase
MNETLPSIYALASMQVKTDLLAEMSEFAQTTKDGFEAGLKGDLPELEQMLKDRVKDAFENELPTMRQEISAQVNAEIEAMIRSVRLVTSRHQVDES